MPLVFPLNCNSQLDTFQPSSVVTYVAHKKGVLGGGPNTNVSSNQSTEGIRGGPNCLALSQTGLTGSTTPFNKPKAISSPGDLLTPQAPNLMGRKRDYLV